MNRTTAVFLCVALVTTSASIYLGLELAASRSETQDAVARVQALQARITELDAARLARSAGFGSAFAPRPSMNTASANAPSEVMPGVSDAAAMAAGANASPAVRRYQRAQAGSNARRLYADFVTEQGLSDDEARGLYDLLASHEMATSTLSESAQPAEAAKSLDEDFSAAAARLLGPTRANEFEAYRQTLVMRFEVAALADQLEGANAPMAEEQRRALLRTISADRSQWEGPTFTEGQSPEEARRTYSDWQESQSARFASLVRSTLTPEQRQHYDDFESARRELRGGN